VAAAPTRWDLDAEAVAIKIRWFGLVVGYLYANLGSAAEPLPLNAILALGFAFNTLDTYWSWRGRVVFATNPLVVSCLEALFIGLLCFSDGGLDSPFRYYYILSLLCCALRYSPRVTAATCGLAWLSYATLFFALPQEQRNLVSLALGLSVLGWVTWAAVALARLIRRAGEQLTDLNAKLEERIAERTRELEETQAQVLHQEKMAAFGLLAAGIAHEVGNPLTGISTLVQLLEQRDPDEYTRERLGLVNAQLTRIQSTLRELVTFSRPASDTRDHVSLRDIVDEALGIAKYYKGVKGRVIRADIPHDLPAIVGIRDQLVQVFFNLVLNAIDATKKGGRVTITAFEENGRITATVSDDGHGIEPQHRERLFRPYFTTKKHGTGLGLFVTRKLVEAHGGTVECESTVGEGTTFRLVFPAIDTPIRRAAGFIPAGLEIPEPAGINPAAR
jgi:signal transduction histidine kinase